MGMKAALALACALAAAGIVALSAGGATASAADFPNITLTPSQGGVGTTVQVDGSNFCTSGCASVVSISFSRLPVATATVQNGAFHATFQVPGGQSYGPHDVEADQTTPNGVLSAHRTFLVTISQTTPTVPASPRPPTPSPKPTSLASPSTVPSDQASPEPSAAASQSAEAPIDAVTQHLPGGPALLAAAAILLVAGAAVAAAYLWRRRNPRQ
jgi:hypothetical protein